MVGNNKFETMFKNLFTVLIAILPLFSIGQEVNFHKNIPWEEVIKMAEKENKFIFVDAYTDWCYWCKVMDKKTFTDEKVISMLNDKFISVKIDAEKGEGINLAAKFRITGYPTVLFLNPKGMLVKNQPGYQETDVFLSICESVLSNKDELTFDGKNLNPGFPEFYLNSFDPEKRKEKVSPETVTAFLDKQKDLTNEISWAIMYNLPISDKYKNYLLVNKEIYIKKYGKYEVDSRIQNIAYDKLNEAIEAKDEKKLENAKDYVKKYFDEKYQESTLKEFDISYYKGIGNWGKFAELVKPTIKEAHPNQINGYAWDIYESCDDKEVINMACDWMSITVEKNQDYALLDTYAAVLYKAKKYDDAEKWANKAIKIGKEAGENVEETDKLLEKIKAEK